MTRLWQLSTDRKWWKSAGVPLRPAIPDVPLIVNHGTLTRARARSVYGPPVEPPSWPPADATWPALPSQSSVNYVDYYQLGDDFRTTLARIQAQLTPISSGSASGYKQVVLPNGLDAEFPDFSMAGVNKYGLYFDRILGFIGPGEDNARIRLKRMSSTVGSEGTMVRLAGRSGSALPGGLVPLNYGFTLDGTVQPDQVYPQGGETGPQLFSGFVQYQGRGAINQRVRLRGASSGNWNSPPGEKFAWNDYRGLGCIWRGCEVDGIDIDGNQRGASPFGGNNSDGSILEDCWLHDSYVSGVTWSFTGNEQTPSAISTNPTTRRVKIEHNSNHSVSGSGKRFTGINHENVGGAIRHLFDQIQCDGGQYWDQSHMAFNSHPAGNGDNADILITFPDTTYWNSLHARYMGCLVIQIAKNYAGSPNAQVTAPTVKLGSTIDGVGGTTLTPYWKTTTGAPTSDLPVSPTTHFVILNS